MNTAAATALLVGVAVVLLRHWIVKEYSIWDGPGPMGNKATEVALLLVGVMFIVVGVIGLIIGAPPPTDDGLDGPNWIWLATGVVVIGFGIGQMVKSRRELSPGEPPPMHRFVGGGAAVLAGLFMIVTVF